MSYNRSARTADGKLFAWGSNDHHQLGIGTMMQSSGSDRVQRTNILAPCAANWVVRNVVAVACGWQNTIAITGPVNLTEGTQSSHEHKVFCWGSNKFGQLGTASEGIDVHCPTAINIYLLAQPYRVQSVSCGWKHSLLVTATGEAFAWGTGRHGELGLGTSILHSVNPTRILTRQMFQQVHCGWQHSVFVSFDGKVSSCGSNKHGQLGTNDSLAPLYSPRLITTTESDEVKSIVVKQISVGWHHCVCITLGNEVLSWGKGSHGQLGIGLDDGAYTPTSILIDPIKHRAISQVACGSEHTLLLTHDGSVYSCGWGEHGNLGHGTTTNEDIPSEILYFQDQQLAVESVRAGGAVSIAIARPRCQI
uniref:Regulator of chromosome condensation (RCC1)like protein putative n=1 Tax=Albugo laibachii Nc14 TaxID=890382 RepID=F0WZV6_9STRA|nr:regulator of chromosome condensation (RCC1)like protein putative [Albugo laibachii Nc14]|eukprot:CCA27034.1 regulator of chromosome condensation (RCC1)like protein putative [Albugo laibachii Nc14]